MKTINRLLSKLTCFALLFFCLQATNSCEDIAAILPVSPPGFVKFYGGMTDQQGADLKQTPDGGFILIGSTTSYGNGGSDIFVVKTDTSGNAEWIQTFGGEHNDKGTAIQLLPEGYILVGDSGKNANGGAKIWVMELDLEGEKQWDLVLNKDRESDESSADIKLLTDQPEDGYIIIGNTTEVDKSKNNYSPTTDFQDIYVAKVIPPLPGVRDSAEIIFEQEHGFAYYDEGIGIQPFADGTYDILGNTSLNAIDSTDQIIYSKISKDGIPIIRTKVIASKARANSLTQDGTMYMVGGTNLEIGKTTGMFWAILDATGEPQGAFRESLSSDTMEISQVAQVIKIDNGYLLAGTINNARNSKNDDFFLRAVPGSLSPSDTTVWEMSTGSQEDDVMHRVIPLTSGRTTGYAFIGTSGFSNITNLSLIKVNENGKF